MNTLETILTVVASGSFVTNIVQLVKLRATKKQANADAQKAFDDVLLKRIDFLDERITKLEKLACWDTTCQKRK